jgi:hypothetical protein
MLTQDPNENMYIYIVIRLKAGIVEREETTTAKHPPAAADTTTRMEELLDVES